MKRLSLLAAFIAAFGFVVNSRAETPTAWRAYWIPWHDTYASWDWTHVQGALFMQWANFEKFPADAKNWEFAACLVSDPAKNARELLQPCMSVQENAWELERWTPGNFPTDRLAALGDGTYLCAVLADGRRISNVSRVTINHAGEPPLKPGIRISPLILFTPDIHTLAIRLIPKPDWHIHYFDLQYPYLCFDGVWAQAGPRSFEGVNSELKPGDIYGIVASFDGETFNPPIKPFLQASVQAKFTQNELKLNSHPDYTSMDPDLVKRLKKWAEAAPGYLSETTPLKFDDTDIRTFDTTFGQK